MMPFFGESTDDNEGGDKKKYDEKKPKNNNSKLQVWTEGSNHGKNCPYNDNRVHHIPNPMPWRSRKKIDWNK
jgi:hypothetical protein